MKKRNLFIVTVVMLAVFALCGQALAISTGGYDVRIIAEMPLDSAEPEMQEKILEARNEIIFSESWSADGVEMYVIRQDGTTEKVPKFSELFPEWDMPVIENSSGVEKDHAMVGDEDSGEIMPLSEDAASFRVYLRNPTSEITSPFTHCFHEGTYVEATVNTLYASEHCNIGFSNYSTGESLAYAVELYPMDSVIMYTFGVESFECGVRASTDSTPGYSILTVAHDIPIAVR